MGDERILLVVPRPKRKTLEHLQDLPDWFQTFGVQVEKSPCDLKATFGNAMDDWFSDPGRTKFGYRMSGGVDNAAWQTAVVYYVAEYWDTQVRGLDTVHFVANIDGAPCFRRNWTSNK